MQAPASHRLTNRFGSLRTDCWYEAKEDLTGCSFDESRAELISEKIKFHSRVELLTALILTVGDLRLLRMKFQETSLEALLDRGLQLRCLSLATTMADQVSKPEGFHLRLLSEPDVSVSTHPAPITQAGDRRPSFQCEKSAGSRRAMLPSQYMALVLWYLNRLYFRRAQSTSSSSSLRRVGYMADL